MAVASRDTTQYVNLSDKRRIAGSLRIWTASDGMIRYVEQMTVRGSYYAPTTAVRIEGSACISSDGVVLRLTNRVTSNGRISSDASFLRRADSATITRDGRTSRVAIPPRAFPRIDHEPISNALVAIMVRLALSRPANELALWPSGTMTVDELARTTVKRRGGDQTLRLFEANDRGIPRTIWLDDRDQFAAQVISAFEVTVATPLMENMPEVLVADLHAYDNAIREKTRRISPERDSLIAIVNATVIDVAGGDSLPNSTILVRGSRIAAMHRGAVAIPAGARVIDARGGGVVPGLWDTHAHFDAYAHTDSRARAALASGVTSVRDLMSDTISIPLQVARIAHDDQLGPRIFGAGFVDGWYPDSLLFGRYPTRPAQPMQVRNSGDVKRLIARYEALGYTSVKIYDALPRDLVALTVVEAHQRGMRVVGHVPVEMTTLDAIDAGFDEIAHLGETVGYLANPDQRDPIIAGVNGVRVAELDLTSMRTTTLIEKLSARRVTVGPTLCIYESRLRSKNATPTMRRAYDNMLGFVRLLRRAGVRTTAGTDNSCTLSRELELLAEAGFTNVELLRIATIDAAGDAQQRDLGEVKVGKLADLVILDGNPIANLSALQKPRVVIKNGVVFDDLNRLRSPGR